MSGIKKIALVEMGGSHDECLYAQIRYLKADGHHVTLICNSSLKSNVEYFDGLDAVHYIELRTANGTQREHVDIATACAIEIAKVFPLLNEVI